MNIRSRRLARAFAAIAAGAAASMTAAQSIQIPGEPQSRPVAIINATIHPVSSAPIENGFVVFKDGVIIEVGSGAFPHSGPEQVEIIDAKGRHLYPGLISADTTIGLSEIGAVRATNDMGETGQVTPEVRAAVAVNPDSALIPVARANGILTVLTVPQSGVVSGYCSIIRMDGWTTEELTINDRAGLVIRWPNVRPRTAWWIQESEEEQLKQARERLDQIEHLFRDAAAYLRARKADAQLPIDLRLESMAPAIDGFAPVFIHASDSAEIESAVAWANRWRLKPIIVGGADLGQCIDLLKAHEVPVIIVGTHRMPSRRDAAYDEPFTLPERLRQAGVRFCIASGEEPAHERNLPYHAAKAVAYGLPADEGLRAVTLSAAEILGVGETLGSIEAGKVATLILTTGNPLEITSDVVAAWIDGSPVDLDNKQKALDRKYRHRYGQP
ncbi:MAG: amidohydrolase family protein [Phycisphaerales bacterium]|nr:amidohydrolase family protein [Phycisphaerales bacterium]